MPKIQKEDIDRINQKNIKKTKNSNILNIIGNYYHYVKKDYSNTVKYYLKSIKQGKNKSKSKSK